MAKLDKTSKKDSSETNSDAQDTPAHEATTTPDQLLDDTATNDISDDATDKPEAADLSGDPEPKIKASPATAADTAGNGGAHNPSKVRAFLGSKQFKIGAPAAIVGLLAVGFFVEPAKFAALNLVSDGKAEFVIVDKETLAPVSDAKITVGDRSVTTDKKGKATLSGVSFGTLDYTITKEAYDKVSTSGKVTPGTTVIGPVKIHSQGIPVTVKAINKLSDKQVKSFTVKVLNSDISAQANKDGVAIVKVPSNKLGAVTFAVSADGFNTATNDVAVAAGKANTLDATLVASGKHYFLSNRSGKLDIYSANLDGSEQTMIIAGNSSIKGDDNTQLIVSPDGKYGAMVSKRDNQKGANGDYLPALFMVDFEQKAIKRIDEGAPGFYLLGWSGNSRIVYGVNHNSDTRADNAKLKLAEVPSGKLSTLASDVYFETFFTETAPAFVYVMRNNPTKADFGVTAIEIATKKSKRIYNGYAYNTIRTAPDTLHIDANGAWMVLNLKSQTISESSPVSYNSGKLYSVSPNGEKVAWTENRDSKRTLIVGDRNGENGAVVTPGVSIVKRWINDNYLVGQITRDNETADYTIDLSTGRATKISGIYVQDYYDY